MSRINIKNVMNRPIIVDVEFIKDSTVTINCRKAPFFRYGDIRQGFIKNVRKLVAN